MKKMMRSDNIEMVFSSFFSSVQIYRELKEATIEEGGERGRRWRRCRVVSCEVAVFVKGMCGVFGKMLFFF